MILEVTGVDTSISVFEECDDAVASLRDRTKQDT